MVYNITKNVDNSQYKHYFWFYKELSNDGCTKIISNMNSFLHEATVSLVGLAK